jgi:hypothetical protein
MEEFNTSANRNTQRERQQQSRLRYTSFLLLPTIEIKQEIGIKITADILNAFVW